MLRDHVDIFELSDELLQKQSNAVNVLTALWQGLEYLYQTVRATEETYTKDGPTTELPFSITCAFHWYAVTACNAVKLVGWLHQKQNPQAPEPADYVKGVVPAVLKYRNKVATHLTTHSPRDDDGPADELASLIPSSAMSNGRFVAGMWAVAVVRGGKTSSSQLLPWSLTEVHEGLRSRYGGPTTKSR